MFRRKRCAYCGRIPVMEHRKAARTECARNSAQLFRVRCSCGNQTEWGLATSGYWRKKVKAMIVRQWNELNSEKLGKFFVAMIGEVRREAFKWGELKRCRMCREVPRSRITPCMNSDLTSLMTRGMSGKGTSSSDSAFAVSWTLAASSLSTALRAMSGNAVG